VPPIVQYLCVCVCGFSMYNIYCITEEISSTIRFNRIKFNIACFLCICATNLIDDSFNKVTARAGNDV
jgi:hypothetical protein